MKKHKVILLPADERILNLHVSERNGNQIEETSGADLLKSIWRKCIHYLFLAYNILFLLVVLSVPILLYILIGITVFGVLFVVKGKLRANQWLKWWGDMLENKRFQKPQLKTSRFYSNSPRKTYTKIEEENVPHLLKTAGKYGYRRVVYLSRIEIEKMWRLDELIRQGMIDKVLVYDEAFEIYEYIQQEDILQEYSWIIHIARDDTKHQSIGGNNLYVSSANVSGSDYNSPFVKTFKQCGQRIMFSKVKLTYNGLLDESMILYFETEYNPQVNDFIKKNYHSIQEKLASKDLRLLYFPALSKENGVNIDVNDVLFYLQADLFTGDQQINEKKLAGWFSDLDIQQLYEFFKNHYKIPDGPSPAFLHCVKNLSLDDLGKEVMYSYSPIWGNTEGQLQQEIDHYIEYIRHPKDHLYFSLAKRILPGEDGYDPDNEFYWEGSQLSEDIKDKIREIKKKTGEERVIETLFHIIHEFRDKNPELCRKLCRQLYEEAGEIHRKQSRIFIDKHHRIFLLDYGNMEIELTPLPKTLFFFMLKYPEGIMFKELYKYKQELLYIYGKIGNRTDLEQMQKSINDMTDATSNSVNEKCSRIKEAFISKIDERIASSYFVTGNRQEAKRITIDRSLVVFEEVI